MKKLISIFAALALVGAISARPRKPAPKPAAKPAATAPAAPAPVAAIAAAPANSGKGHTFFIEGRGTFTLSNGTSTAQSDGDTTGASVTQKLSSASGFGGGGTLGVQIAENLGLVGSFDYRSISSRKWSQNGANSNTTIQNVKNTMIVGLGLRPSVQALGGTFYAGAGVALVLPYSDTTTIDITGTNLTAGSTAQGQTKSDWNLGIGAYGELGYNYNLTNNLYLGLGVRMTVITSNNDGKSQVTTTSSTGAAGSTLLTGASLANNTTNYSATKDATNTGGLKSDGTTDFGFNVNVGFRF